MPVKNSVKLYTEDGYYHVYNRGVDRNLIFRDVEDYLYFENLLARYLSNRPGADNKGRKYPWLRPRISLMAYCLMPNHFHMLVFQKDKTAMTELVRAVCSSYSMYFNEKYQRIGSLFQGKFRAVLVDNQPYLDHISRYIHLNPGEKKYQQWYASSYKDYVDGSSRDWLDTREIIAMYSSREEYKEFVNDYAALHDELDILKHELANY